MKGRVTALFAGAAIALTGVTAIGGTAGAGGKGKPATTPAVDASHEWQSTVTDLTNQLWAAADKDAKFSGVTLDQSTKTVVVYRKGGGSSPAYATARASKPSQRIEFRSSLLSAAETKRAMDNVDRMSGQFAAEGLEVTSTSTDFTGQVVVHTAPKRGAKAQTNATLKMSMVASSQAAVVPGGAVKVVNDGSVSKLTNRWQDTAPYWGGNRLIMFNGASAYMCSSGFFGVSSTNHKRYMITASHCVTKDKKFYVPAGYDSSGRVNRVTLVGTASSIDYVHDMAYVPTSGAPKIYDGTGGDAEHNSAITNQIHPSPGQKICHSGATSQRTCGDATVFAFNHGVKACDENGANCRRYDVWSAVSKTNSNLARGGDSGGPVYMPSLFGNLAMGIVSSGGYLPCAGTPIHNCGSVMYFGDVFTEGFTKRHIDMAK